MKNVLKSLIYFALYFIFQLVVQMAFMIIGVLSGIRTESDLMDFSMNHLFLMMIISNVVTIVLFALFIKIRKKTIKEEWSIVPTKIKLCIYPALSTFLLSFAWAFATYDLSFANTEQMEKSALFYSNIIPGLGVVMMGLMLLVAQPIMEEVLCRGIMLNKLKESFPTWAAILVSSLIFGLAHLMAGGVWLTIGATLMGIYFGIVFAKTKSLYPAIIAHTFANLPDFITPLLPELGFGVRIVFAVILAIVSIVMMVLFVKSDRIERNI